MGIAGFRLWERVTIEELLDHLHEAVLEELGRGGMRLPEEVSLKLHWVIKRVLNEDLYASPACGTSVLCRPSEEWRAKPWSHQSAGWGLVSQADPSLELE